MFVHAVARNRRCEKGGYTQSDSPWTAADRAELDVCDCLVHSCADGMQRLQHISV